MEPMTVDAIRTDRTGGAAELAAAGVALLGTMTTRDEILATARALALARPTMAPIANLAALFYAETAAGSSGDAVARRLLAERREGFERQVEVARSALAGAKVVATLSWSSTVAAVIAGAAHRKTKIVVAESRPDGEGRFCAERLLAHGFAVTVVTDAAFGKRVAAADRLLIGADLIGVDGTVVNKTGSYPAALAAADNGVPVYVIADTAKIDPTTDPATAFETGPGSAVWPDRPERGENPIFETVPPRLITGFITEAGRLAPDAIKKEAARWDRLRKALFA